MAEQVIKIAASEVGVEEQGGNNRGKRVEEYLHSVGLGPGDPWCAAFVAWCLREAGVKLGTDGWPRTGYCPTIETWAKSNKCLSRTPRRGDVFLLLDSEGPYHTGFVSEVNSDGTVDTIEGNTNRGGSADGDGVFRRKRYVSSCSFVAWHKVLRLSRKAKIFKNPNGATIVVDGASYPITSMTVNGEPVTSTEIIVEY